MLKQFDIHGCVFDFDGTIVHSEHIHMQAYEHMAASLGMKLPMGFLESIVGFSDSEMILKLAAAWEDKIPVEDILARKSDFYRTVSGETCELIAGVERVIKAFSAQVPLALATNSFADDVYPILESYDLKKYFQAIFTSESVTHPKPNPEMYVKASASLGCSPPHCLAFEDSVAGVTAVRAAGLRLITVGTMYGPDRLGSAWRHIRNFRDPVLEDLVR